MLIAAFVMSVVNTALILLFLVAVIKNA